MTDATINTPDAPLPPEAELPPLAWAVRQVSFEGGSATATVLTLKLAAEMPKGSIAAASKRYQAQACDAVLDALRGHPAVEKYQRVQEDLAAAQKEVHLVADELAAAEARKAENVREVPRGTVGLLGTLNAQIAELTPRKRQLQEALDAARVALSSAKKAALDAAKEVLFDERRKAQERAMAEREALGREAAKTSAPALTCLRFATAGSSSFPNRSPSQDTLLAEAMLMPPAEPAQPVEVEPVVADDMTEPTGEVVP
jgi:hypothetical protein